MMMYVSSYWGKLSRAWGHHLHMKRQAKDTVFWPYLFEISKIADRALSHSCYLDASPHHIANELSFEEKDPFQ